MMLKSPVPFDAEDLHRRYVVASRYLFQTGIDTYQWGEWRTRHICSTFEKAAAKFSTLDDRRQFQIIDNRTGRVLHQSA